MLVRPGKKARVGAELVVSEELSLTVAGVTETGERIVRFHYDGVFEDILSRVGSMPLPPYIHEKLKDKDRYQTVYCKTDGSAAAPTAGGCTLPKSCLPKSGRWACRSRKFCCTWGSAPSVP